MNYFNYALPNCYSEIERELDDQRVNSNQLDLKRNAKFFGLGLLVGSGMLPGVACAADEVPRRAMAQGKKRALKRLSNAAACSAIVAVCKSGSATAGGQQLVAQNSDKIVDVASKVGVNPQSLALFGCGFAVSWCVKYMIFDK
mmetsp:Transcript_31164/g.51951  ORF Transcript_31164/g.51951 Transcript_31164/m.51951 type:complete len:143 (-) Transcript_31164:71-499(-)